jgi:hypothetical protein
MTLRSDERDELTGGAEEEAAEETVEVVLVAG